MKKTFYCEKLKTGIFFNSKIDRIGIHIPTNFVEITFGFFGFWFSHRLLIYILGSLLGEGIYYDNAILHRKRFVYPTLSMMKHYYKLLRINYLNRR